jgi:hypothetical protein
MPFPVELLIVETGQVSTIGVTVFIKTFIEEGEFYE